MSATFWITDFYSARAMATIDILRRRIEMAQAKADEYEGVILGQGIGIGSNKFVYNEVVLASTPEIPFPEGCTAIFWKAAAPWNVTGGKMIIFNADDTALTTYNCISMNSMTTGPLSETVRTNAKYLRMTFNVDYIDDCFILDYTHNVYLFKGKNV